jgi:hypothetical protein
MSCRLNPASPGPSAQMMLRVTERGVKRESALILVVVKERMDEIVGMAGTRSVARLKMERRPKDAKVNEDEDKAAKRNRIIGQKRMKRKSRKGN